MAVSPTLSLLWQSPDSIPERPASDSLYEDLNVRRLVRSIALNPRYENYVRDILLTITTDASVIRYRQQVMVDLLNNPALVAQLHQLLEEIIALEEYLKAPQWEKNVLRQVAWRLSELQRYVDTVIGLHTVLVNAGDALQSTGLRQLRQSLTDIVESDIFQHLRAELPDLVPKIRDVRSITVGINLDLELRPLSATLLDTHEAHFVNQTMLSRLFGMGSKKAKEGTPSDGPIHDARFVAGVERYQVELNDRNSPFMPKLFRDLSELMDETSKPVVRALRKYTQINSQVLIMLKQDIAFYLGAVQAIQRIREVGMPITQPKILPLDERTFHVEGMYNINLLFQQFNKTVERTEIIGNDVHFGEDGRIFILTGPNQGGKTTYTTAIGLVQLLAQAGLPVPATSARISPVDQIYTHFAKEERPNLEAGRLGEEARRLNSIFERATRHSLILLNESLASTAASESLFLAQDVVRAFRLLGVRAVFATHLHELAAACDDLNGRTDGDSKIISVVSKVQVIDEGNTIRRTYQITPAPPESKSYALELAARYGISFAQLKTTIESRNTDTDAQSSTQTGK
ncbi:MAG: hypothetical protein AAFV98_01270 [Chloroflexota bacterium]